MRQHCRGQSSPGHQNKNNKASRWEGFAKTVQPLKGLPCHNCRKQGHQPDNDGDDACAGAHNDADAAVAAEHNDNDKAAARNNQTMNNSRLKRSCRQDRKRPR